MAVFWDAALCSLVGTVRRITLVMEAVISSETSVSIYQITSVTSQKTAIFTLVIMTASNVRSNEPV
jgi:hypothetical protein